MNAFPEIKRIPFEGPRSNNPLAFRWYKCRRAGRRKDDGQSPPLLRDYWHTFRVRGAIRFGGSTMERPGMMDRTRWRMLVDGLELPSNFLRSSALLTILSRSRCGAGVDRRSVKRMPSLTRSPKS